MSIPQHLIEQIRERARFSDLASDLPKLKRSGSNLIACCPFHEDDSPSLSINEEKGLFHCFGCGAKGNLFDYVMKRMNLSFPESVRFIAGRVGISVEANETPAQKAKADREKEWKGILRRVCHTALEVFAAQLRQGNLGAEGRDYLNQRQVPKEQWDSFCLGYAPDQWSHLADAVLKQLAENKISIKEETALKALNQLGLTKPSQREGQESLDIFRGRVMFPICRSDGAAIAFGGRAIDPNSKLPKYINCRESLIYRKGSSFFGLQLAATSLRKLREVFLVEGYLDVLAMSRSGLPNTLATCGTAVTPEHVRVLSRMVDRVTLVFDGDKAGIRAAGRSFEQFLNSRVTVDVVILPGGNDPDSLVRAGSADALKNAVTNSRRSAFGLYIQSLLDESNTRVSGAIASGRSAVVDGNIASRCVSLVARVKNPVERELLLREASNVLGVTFDSLLQLLRQNLVERQFKEQLGTPRTSSAVSRGGTVDQKSLGISPTGGFWNQLLVSVICEPALAESFLEIDELIDGKSLRDAAPRSVVNFVESVASKIPEGFRVDRPSEELAKLLRANNLPADALLGEAKRQMIIGGTKPKSIVEESVTVTKRMSLREEVFSIRTQEADLSDVDKLAEIAQKKLEARRSLEKL